MKKILTIVFVIFCLIICTSCDNNIESDDSKIYLDSKFYKDNEYINVDSKKIEELDDSTFLVYTYNSYCSLKIPCEQIFKKVMDKYNISMYSMPIREMKKTYIYDTVRYAPSVIIIKNKNIIAYLDAESDEDLNKYQDENEFEKWLDEYIHLENKK